MKTTATAWAVVAAGVALATAPAAAQDLPETTISYVGSLSSLAQYQQRELPFWSKHIPEASGGRITTQVTSYDQMGLNGSEVYRLLERGMFHIGSTVADYTVQDAPELEGMDIPGLAGDVDTAERIATDFRPVLDDIMAKRFGSRVLAIAPYPAQLVFCKAEINSIEDLKGKRIRVSGRSNAEFLGSLGAEAITMPFGEVSGSLERGIIDCAVSGTLPGYAAGWHEVATHLFLGVPLGWDYVVTAVNLQTWDGFGEEVQEFLTTELRDTYEAAAWKAAREESAGGLACLTGDGQCAQGTPGKMTLVRASEGDLAVARERLEKDVLPRWASRVTPEWVARWNETIGKITGLTVNGS